MSKFDITGQVNNFWQSIKLSQDPFLILDLILVAVILYYLFIFIQKTKSIKLFYGIFVLILIAFIGRTLQLQTLNYLMRAIWPLFLIAIPVVFQPELRRVFEKFAGLNRSKNSLISISKNEFIQIIINSVAILSKKALQAVLIIKNRDDLSRFIKEEVEIGAKLTPDLIQTLCQKEGPFNAKAIFIENNLVKSAGVTFKADSSSINLIVQNITAQSDALIILVSQTSGQVSAGFRGELKRNISEEELLELLKNLY